MNIEHLLAGAIHESLRALYGQDADDKQIQLQRTKREFEGHLTLVVFPLLRLSRKKPAETAQEIGTYLQEHTELVEKFNAVNGFLNLTVAPAK